jgi:hypothetical protein
MQAFQNGEPASPQHFNGRGLLSKGEGSHLRVRWWGVTGRGGLGPAAGAAFGTLGVHRAGWQSRSGDERRLPLDNRPLQTLPGRGCRIRGINMRVLEQYREVPMATLRNGMLPFTRQSRAFTLHQAFSHLGLARD